MRNTKPPQVSRAEELLRTQESVSRFEVFLGRPNGPVREEPCDHPWHRRSASAAKRRKRTAYDYFVWQSSAPEYRVPITHTAWEVPHCKFAYDKNRGGNTLYCPACGRNNLGDGSPNRAEDVTIAGIRFPFVSLLTPETIEAELCGEPRQLDQNDTELDVYCYRYFRRVPVRPCPQDPKGAGEIKALESERRAIEEKYQRLRAKQELFRKQPAVALVGSFVQQAY